MSRAIIPSVNMIHMKGGGTLIDHQLLRDTIKESGITKEHVARQLGLTREGLYLKLNGKSEFKFSEVVKLKDMLHLKQSDFRRIFFMPERETDSRPKDGVTS